MKKRKVIHIDHRVYGSYFPNKDSDYYYLAGWSGAVARQIPKFTKKYVVENWRPERDVTRPIVCEVQGVICRLFPTIRVGSFRDWSSAMLRELRAQAGINELLINHSSIHRNSLYAIAAILGNIPIIAQHHGDSPSMVRFRQKRRFKILLSAYAEKVFLKKVDHFFVLRQSEKDFLARFVPMSHISIQTMGVDFGIFKPIGKKLARRKLNLPQHKKILLYAGKFYKLKGVDIIIKVFQELRQKFEVELMLVGGCPDHELYDSVKASGARYYGIVPRKDMPLYFNAADVYLLPSFSAEYRGIDVATIESLACGTPIVSTTLRDFPTEEWQMLGKIPKDGNDVINCVSEILNNPSPYHNCRKIAMKYYDWKNIIRQTVKVYDRLFDKYYKN